MVRGREEERLKMQTDKDGHPRTGLLNFEKRLSRKNRAIVGATKLRYSPICAASNFFFLQESNLSDCVTFYAYFGRSSSSSSSAPE